MRLNQLSQEQIKLFIAAHLNTTAASIVKIKNLYKIWCVVVAGRRPRFVSKKQVLGDDWNQEFPVIAPVVWKLEATTRRQEGKKWVARIDGLDPKYTFKRTFLQASDIEWGKFGMKIAKFQIEEIGYYQDSDGDYFRVFVNGDDSLDAECCSKLEVLARFGAVRV